MNHGMINDTPYGFRSAVEYDFYGRLSYDKHKCVVKVLSHFLNPREIRGNVGSCLIIFCSLSSRVSSNLPMIRVVDDTMSSSVISRRELHCAVLVLVKNHC